MATRCVAPRDFAALRDSLLQIHALEAWLKEGRFFSGLTKVSDKLAEIAGQIKQSQELLDDAIVENPPAKLSDGGLFAQGHNKELDELRAIKTDSRKFLKELEERERGESGTHGSNDSYRRHRPHPKACPPHP